MVPRGTWAVWPSTMTEEWEKEWEWSWGEGSDWWKDGHVSREDWPRSLPWDEHTSGNMIHLGLPLLHGVVFLVSKETFNTTKFCCVWVRKLGLGARGTEKAGDGKCESIAVLRYLYLSGEEGLMGPIVSLLSFRVMGALKEVGLWASAAFPSQTSGQFSSYLQWGPSVSQCVKVEPELRWKHTVSLHPPPPPSWVKEACKS